MNHFTNESIAAAIENLLVYGCKNLGLHTADLNFSRNLLLEIFGLDAPPADIVRLSVPPGGKPAYLKTQEKKTKFDAQTQIFDALTDYAIFRGLITPEERVNFETRLIGAVTPTPAQVVHTFKGDVEEFGKVYATKNLYNLSVKSNYIRMADIKKNIQWKYKGKFGDLVVTINVAKPEKTPEQIAREAAAPPSSYPKCVLCVENEGFAGNSTRIARHTLRTVPVDLAGQHWALQFSPYQYYKEHCIALSCEHRPMTVDKDCLNRLLDFVRQYQHYFMGSNAALPIVGGSILSHDHYQGGGKHLPLFKRGGFKIVQKKFKDVKISKVRWYNSVVRVESENMKSALKAATHILECWKKYNDETNHIRAFTVLGEDAKIPHSTITPIARYDKEENSYILDLVLRNNRTTDTLPYGIFHPAEHLHHIKKEGIGIIEVAGIFILPGRLKDEVESGRLDKKTISKACEEILQTTAVFKNDAAGQKAFDKFLKLALR